MIKDDIEMRKHSPVPQNEKRATHAERITSCVVTGANRGIGLEVVRQLAQRGMRVILGARDLEKGCAAAQSLTHARDTVFPRQLDVADQQSIDRLLRDVTNGFGRLDVLVNNA